MRLAETFANATLDEIKRALDGGKLSIYSTGRPPTANHPITRSKELAAFVFASPAFGSDGSEGAVAPLFVEPSVIATAVGTPGFARAFTADGAVVADFSVGPGNTEIKLTSSSTTEGFPVAVEAMKIMLPAEKVEWAKTEFGHAYVTNLNDPFRKMSMRG
jgi:hypothetical protein